MSKRAAARQLPVGLCISFQPQAPAGTSKAVTAGAVPLSFSTWTRAVLAILPWASLEVPLSMVDDIDVAMLAHGTDLAGLVRVVPGPFLQHHHALANAVSDDGAGQQGAAVVEHAHHVAAGDAAALASAGLIHIGSRPATS